MLLFVLQLYLTFNGVEHFGKYWNPVLLFTTYLGIFLLFQRSLYYKTDTTGSSRKLKIAGATLALLSIAAWFPLLRQMIQRIPEPVVGSDVVPQLEILFDRFSQGIFPYSKIDLPQSKPFPVYMPFHWLPVGMSRLLHIDPRWSGLFLLVPVFVLYGWSVVRNKVSIVSNILMVLLPFFVLLAYTYWGDGDIPLSLETTITAYYLVLALGLYCRNFWLTVLGISLCLLSRYTMIFWLPLFLVLLYQQQGLRRGITAIAIPVACIICFYIPFVVYDPSIFLTGLKYHNDCAVGEWQYSAWTFEMGFYFAGHINALIGGSFVHKVMVARIIQATVMLLVTGGGLLYYQRIRDRVNFYDYSLGILYLSVTAFYFFGPLTYRYYLIVPMTLSAVLCARVMIAGRQPAVDS